MFPHNEIRYEMASTVKAYEAIGSGSGMWPVGSSSTWLGDSMSRSRLWKRRLWCTADPNRQNWHSGAGKMLHTQCFRNNWMGRNIMRENYFNSCMKKSSSIKWKALWNRAATSGSKLHLRLEGNINFKDTRKRAPALWFLNIKKTRYQKNNLYLNISSTLQFISLKSAS
jgi:hypothetical protein